MLNALSVLHKFFFASEYTWTILLLVATVLLICRRRLIVICKTLPRDLRFFRLLIKTSMHLSNYKKKNMTFIDLMEVEVKKNPKKPIFYYEDQIWSFENINKFSNKIGSIFCDEHDKGDVVALLMGNCAEYVGIWLGLGKIGLITALINTNLKNRPLIHCLKRANAKAIIYDEEFDEAVEEISEEIGSLKKYRWGRNASEDKEKINLRQLIECASDQPPTSYGKIAFSDKILYMYTSGTTGLPKAAIITHQRLLMMSSILYYVLGIKEDDIIYNPLPLYHIAGGLGGIIGSLTYGSSVVIKRKFSAGSYWPDCIKYNCTVGLYIGEMCRYVMTAPPKPEDTQHKVRLLLGSGMKTSMWRNFQKRFNVDNICEVYGSTEGNANIINIDKTVGAVGFIPRILPESWLPMSLIRVDEFGEPIRNSDGFCLRCKPNEPGLLIGIIQESNPLSKYSGYVGNKTENEKKIIWNLFKKGDKAFLSGDIFVMDELGYVYFKDRIGDTFRWKGENVSTAEVEGIISSITGLRDVIVYGVEIEGFEGKAGMATIFDPNLNLDLKRFESEIDRNLPPYARPLFLRLTDGIAMTGTFKLKKLHIQKEGFNPSIIKDKLYFKKAGKYVELTQNIYDDIICGRVRI